MYSHICCGPIKVYVTQYINNIIITRKGHVIDYIVKTITCIAMFQILTGTYIYTVSDLVLAQSVPSSTSLNSVIRVSLTGRETDRLVDTSFGPLLSPKTGLFVLYYSVIFTTL